MNITIVIVNEHFTEQVLDDYFRDIKQILKNRSISGSEPDNFGQTFQYNDGRYTGMYTITAMPSKEQLNKQS